MKSGLSFLKVPKSKFDFPKGCRVTETVGYAFTSNLSEKEKQRAFQAYANKFDDLIKWNHIEASGLCHSLRSLAQQGNDAARETLFALAENACSEVLRIIASLHDLKSTLRAVQMVKDSIQTLTGLGENDRAIQFAATITDCWPALLWRQARNRRSVEQRILCELQLGSNVHYKLKGKLPFSIEAQIAESLHQKILRYRNGPFSGKIPSMAQKLQPFSKNTALRWWKVAEEIFIADFGVAFENADCLAKWWRNSAYRSLRQNERRSFIRRDIKREIKRSYLIRAM